jgi:hypothetical protein
MSSNKLQEVGIVSLFTDALTPLPHIYPNFNGDSASHPEPKDIFL